MTTKKGFNILTKQDFINLGWSLAELKEYFGIRQRLKLEMIKISNDASNSINFNSSIEKIKQELKEIALAIEVLEKRRE